MVANHDNMLDTFNLCNMEYFEGKLLFPQFALCHEMIHYYLAYFGIDRSCKHGKKFNEMAARLNASFGLHITPTVDLSEYKRRKGTPSISYWFVKKLYM